MLRMPAPALRQVRLSRQAHPSCSCRPLLVWPIQAPCRCKSSASDKSGAGSHDSSDEMSSDTNRQSTGGALWKSLSDVARAKNRTSGASNLLLAGGTEDQWRELDKKVNKYPIQRSFTAIGSGGEEFRRDIVQCVQSVVGAVHQECVAQRASSGGKYLSVTVGPVWLENGDQIIQIYANLKEDVRVKWII